MSLNYFIISTPDMLVLNMLMSSILMSLTSPVQNDVEKAPNVMTPLINLLVLIQKNRSLAQTENRQILLK